MSFFFTSDNKFENITFKVLLFTILKVMKILQERYRSFYLTFVFLYQISIGKKPQIF